MRWLFSRSYKSFSLPKTIINFVFASYQLLTNFENAQWNPPQNFLACDWAIFSSANSHWLQGKKMCKGMLTCHWRLPVWFYRITGGFLEAFSVSKSPGSLKRVTGRIFKLVSNFEGGSYNFKFDYLINGEIKKEGTYLLIIRSLKKYSSCDAIPLNSTRRSLPVPILFIQYTTQCGACVGN